MSLIISFFCLSSGWNHQTLNTSKLLAVEALERWRVIHFYKYIVLSLILLNSCLNNLNLNGCRCCWQDTENKAPIMQLKFYRSRRSSKEERFVFFWLLLGLIVFLSNWVCFIFAAKACDGWEECAAERTGPSIPGWTPLFFSDTDCTLLCPGLC